MIDTIITNTIEIGFAAVVAAVVLCAFGRVIIYYVRDMRND